MNEVLGALAAALAILGTVPYVRDMLRGKTQPHAFTWLIWGVLTGIGCAAQVDDGGGPGAWSAGVSAVVCMFVFGYAVLRGERDIVLVDWLSLLGAALAGLAWIVTNNPLWSVVLISLIDAIAYIPTFRKSFLKPWSETISAYIWPYPKHVLSLFALTNFTLTTSLYSFVIMTVNAGFVAFILLRRRSIPRPL